LDPVLLYTQFVTSRGGAFAEWNFLRGIKEGWIPRIPSPTVASQDLYGTCYDIYNRTNDDYSATVEEYPDPRTLDWNQWQGWDATDDFVMSDPNIPDQTHSYGPHPWYGRWIVPTGLVVLCVGLFQLRRRHVQKRDRLGYTELKV
jgi:hypothetical protein